MGYNPPLIFGPVPPENNPPINPQYYQPSVFYIANIELGPSTLVTTTVNHNYVVGQNTRLLIPFNYGAQSLNEQEALVTAIPMPNQALLALNSMGASAFNASPFYGPTPPQIMAIGDVNSGTINASGNSNMGTTINGAFIDISPN